MLTRSEISLRVDDLSFKAKVRVFVFNCVEAVRTACHNFFDAIALHCVDVLFDFTSARYSLPDLLAVSPLHFSSVPSIEKETSAFCITLAMD